MSTYKITRLIRSAVRLTEPCEINGILFDPGIPFRSEYVRVSETLSAASYRDASKLFDRHLLPVVDAVTVVTGAALAPLGGSTLIQKRRSKYVYLHAVGRGPAGYVTLAPSHHTDMIKRLAKAATHLVAHPQPRYAAYYLRQAALAEHVVTGTFHTLQAAEALSVKGRKTSRTRLRDLMGDELFGYFYERDPLLGETRRNALAHGRLIDEQGLQPVTTKLQERLLREVRGYYEDSVTPALSPIHGFVLFEPVGLFLEPIGALPDLPGLIDTALDHKLHSASDPRWVGVEVSRRLWRRW
jgi:hypothetical protein